MVGVVCACELAGAVVEGKEKVYHLSGSRVVVVVDEHVVWKVQSHRKKLERIS